MLLPIKIATRFLKSSKGQTILITIGIAIGVSVQIFIGLLIQGLQTSLVDKTIGSSSQITINAEEKKDFDIYESIMSDIETKVNIKAITAALDNPAIVTIKDNPKSIVVRGFTLSGANDIYKLNKALIEGEMPEEADSVIVGKNFFEEAEYSVGQIINVTIPQIGQKEVKIVGVFDLKVAAVNNSWFVTSIANAQSLFNKEGKASSIEMQIEEVFDSNIIAEDVRLLIPDSYVVTDWQAQNEELLSGLSGQSISSIMIQVFVIISVVLAIASVLAISVMQKSKQIGILKAMGIKDKSSSVIFLTQGFILGLMGAIVGIALGIGLIVAFTTFALNPDGTPLIPMTLNIGFIALSGGIAVVASMAASLIPAFRSMRMDPIEVIKNG